MSVPCSPIRLLTCARMAVRRLARGPLRGVRVGVGKTVGRSAAVGCEAGAAAHEDATSLVVASGGHHRKARGALLDALLAVIALFDRRTRDVNRPDEPADDAAADRGDELRADAALHGRPEDQRDEPADDPPGGAEHERPDDGPGD